MGGTAYPQKKGNPQSGTSPAHQCSVWYQFALGPGCGGSSQRFV